MKPKMGTLRLTAFPPGDGPYERWELTVEETGEVLATGDTMPVDQQELQKATRAYWERFLPIEGH